MKLLQLLKEITKDKAKKITYKDPNFDNEWAVEATRYPELKKLGKKKWVELAKKGKTT